MPTQYTGFGYPYPQPVDPVRDGAVNIQALASVLTPNAQSYPGQPCIMGNYGVNDYPNIRIIYYNYSPGTDQYGLFSMATPFTKALIYASCVGRDFRLDAANPQIAMEGMTQVSQVTWYIAKRSDGGGLGNTYVAISAIAIGV